MHSPGRKLLRQLWLQRPPLECPPSDATDWRLQRSLRQALHNCSAAERSPVNLLLWLADCLPKHVVALVVGQRHCGVHVAQVVYPVQTRLGSWGCSLKMAEVR